MYKEDREIKLTKKGEKLGKELYEKHLYFYELFLKIGVNPTQASKEACSIEHIISQETFEKIKNFIEKINK